MAEQINRDLFKLAIGGIAGATVVGNDDSSFSTLLGIGIGTSVAMLGDFRISENSRDSAIRKATKNTVRTIDNSHIIKSSQTQDDRIQRVFDLASEYAKDDVNTAKTLDKNDIIGTLNQNTLQEYRDSLNNMSREQLTSHSILLQENRDIFYNANQGFNVDTLVNNSSIRLNADTDSQTRLQVLGEHLETLGYPKGTPEHNLKLTRLSSLATIPDTPITFREGVMQVGSSMNVKITSRAIGENGVSTPFHLSNGNYEDTKLINPFAHTILKDDAENWKAVAKAIDPSMIAAYRLNDLRQQVGGLAPDEALGLAHQFLQHLEPEEQVKALTQISNQFNKNYSHNMEATSSYADQIGRGETPTFKPSSYSGLRSNMVEYGDSFNFTGNTGVLSSQNPLNKLETTSSNGITKSENKRLIEKLVKDNNMLSLAGIKGDEVTALPATFTPKLNPNTGKIERVSNPYNQVLSTQVDIGRDIGVTGNREQNLKGMSEDNNLAKQLYKQYGGVDQYNTSVALRSKNINPENLVRGGDNFGSLLSTLFGSNVTTSDGFGLLSREAAKGFIREGKEIAHLDSIATPEGNSFAISNEEHRRILRGELSVNDLKNNAKKSLYTFSEKTNTRLTNALDVLTNYKDLKANSKDSADLLEKIKASNLFGTDFNYDKITPEKLTTTLDNYLFKDVRKSNLFIRGNSSLSYKEDVKNTLARRDEITKDIKGLSANNLEESLLNLQYHLNNSGFKQEIQNSMSAYYLVPGSKLGYGSDGSPLTVPNTHNNYRLSSLSLHTSTDETGNMSFNKAMFGFDAKLEFDKLTNTKTFGISSKAQVGLQDQDVINKILLLNHFNEDGRLSVDNNRQSLTFKLQNNRFTTDHKNFTNAMNGIDSTTAPLLSDVMKNNVIQTNDINKYREEAKKIGVDKEFEAILKPVLDKYQDKKLPKKARVLHPEFTNNTISFKDFVNKPVESSFQRVGYKPVIERNKIPTTDYTKNLNRSMTDMLNTMFGSTFAKNINGGLSDVVNSVLNTSIRSLKQADPNSSMEEILQRRITENLNKKLGSGSLGKTVGSQIGSVIGSTLGLTYDNNISGTDLNRTLGYAFESELSDNLSSVFSKNATTALNRRTNNGSKQGQSVGKSLGSQVNGNKITNKQMGEAFGSSIGSAINISYKPVLRNNNEVENLMKTFNQVGIIMDEDSTGGSTFKKLTSLLKDSSNPEFGNSLIDSVPSNALRETITSQLDNRKGQKGLEEGLSSFVMSFANKEKSSQENLTTPMLNTQKRLEELLNRHLEDTSNKNNLNELNTFVKTYTGTSVKTSKGLPVENIEDVSRNAIKNELDFVHQFYTSNSNLSTSLYELTTNPQKAIRLSDFFINAQRLADRGTGNITELAVSNNPVAVANLGNTKNGMSWMTNKQLRDNGLSLDELNLFGRMNSNTIADDQILTMLVDKNHNTINNQLTGTDRENSLVRVLNTNPSNRRNVLKKEGFDVNGLVGSYELTNKTKNGFKNVPIILEDSNMFGEYIKDGTVRNKRVNTLFARLIETDIRHKNASSDKERSLLSDRMEKYTEEIKKHVTPSLWGKDNLGKKLLSREAVNSVYSRALPVSGSLENYSKRTGLSSVSSVSMDGLRLRLSKIDPELLDGVDITKVSNKDLLKQSFLEKTEEGLYQVMLNKENKKVPLYSIMTREPSAGPGSSAVTQLLLDPNSTAERGYINTVGNSSFNKYFKFLDFDADQVLEAYPEGKVSNFDMIKNVWNKGNKINTDLTNLIDFTENLGVKGKKQGITTFLDIAERPHVNSIEDFNNELLNEVSSTMEKGTARKSISPTVTKASQQISEAVMSSLKQSGNPQDYQVALRSRILSHYLTENLIKTMHTTTKDYNDKPVTVAERLSGHLNNNNIEAFNRELDEHLEDTLIKGRLSKIEDESKKTRLTRDARESIDYIKNAMLQRKDGETIATPVDLKGTSKKSFEQSMEDYNQLKGGHVANPTIPITETGDEGIVHNAKKGYYTASEIVKDNYTRNKKLFLGAGLAVGASALLLQQKPDFGDNKVHANTNGMLLGGGRTALQETAADLELRGSSHPATEFLHKFGNNPKQMTVDSERTDYSQGDEYQDMSSAIMGNNMSSIRILTN